MADMQLSRNLPLAGMMHGGPGVSISAAPAANRINLRADEAAMAGLSKALGVTLPSKPKTSASKGSRHVLWIGPDEWLVIDETGDPAADCAKVKPAHSAVDVSHRNTAILVSGPFAADVISAGCPQDLSLESFPVGACSRTVFGKIEIVLYRTAEDAFRVECWRSFSDYAFEFLKDAARGL
ncbi:MAG: sarcosine oxidase subunit gamma [Ahrensia sp.]|nr:sarcosine oxidase subunit gamma [Ahrensia sp.]